MNRIHRLDPVVANQIAAGEVVERPASVVKELVENSLDAKASHIVVEVQEGGRSIEVRDNGSGLDPEDLPLAVERHTTSKLARIEDLEQSRTLGFRGEALAAIASVSRLTLSSRPPSASVGYRLTVQFGVAEAVEPVAMGVGTRVSVEQVFAQQPARLKAMRTPAAEFGTIQQVVQQLAVAHPEVRLELRHDGRQVLETPGRGDRLGTLLALFGRDVVQSLIPIDYESERGISVSGYIGPAHVNRANRFGQGFYVNGRWVTNWQLRAAVEEAYRPNIPDRRYPYYWFWLEMLPSDVDPNAHPTKAEVRLVYMDALRAILYRQVRDALALGSPAPEWETSAREETSLPRTEALTFELLRADADTAESPVLHRQFQTLVPLAQWQAKYILAQGPDGLCLIDQHAAHERVYFERFKRLGGQVTTSQPLLVAVPETLSGSEWAALEGHRGHLERLGFEVEHLGGTTIAVRAVPTAFHDLDTHQGLLRVVLEMLSGGDSAKGTLHPVSWAEEADYAMAACKAAIKANRPMSFQEMEALLDEMSRAGDPRGCPHGRPTMVVLTLEEVDRRFGRRG